MDDVKRYGQGRVCMIEMKDGPFVRYIDHIAEIIALRARLEAVTEERNVQNDLRQIAEDAADDFRARAERAEAALATARRDAYERAAKAAREMADLYGPNGSEAAIRALANEAET